MYSTALVPSSRLDVLGWITISQLPILVHHRGAVFSAFAAMSLLSFEFIEHGLRSL